MLETHSVDQAGLKDVHLTLPPELVGLKHAPSHLHVGILKDIFLFPYVCWCLLYVCKCLLWPEENVIPLGTGVTGGCELPYVGAGN